MNFPLEQYFFTMVVVAPTKEIPFTSVGLCLIPVTLSVKKLAAYMSFICVLIKSCWWCFHAFDSILHKFWWDNLFILVYTLLLILKRYIIDETLMPCIELCNKDFSWLLQHTTTGNWAHNYFETKLWLKSLWTLPYSV